jgi:hypothetical protein
LYLTKEVFVKEKLLYLMFTLSLHLNRKLELSTENIYLKLILMVLYIDLNILFFSIVDFIVSIMKMDRTNFKMAKTSQNTIIIVLHKGI